VLEARAAVETQQLPATFFTRVATLLGSVAEAVATEDVGGDGRRDDASSTLDDVLGARDDAHVRSTKDGVDESLAPAEAATPRTASLRRAESMTRAAGIADCPLTCSVSAIGGSMPRRLSELRAVDASIAVSRVWTTMLCISVLERLNNSWIWGDGCALAMRNCARMLPCAHAHDAASRRAATFTLRRSAPSLTVR
jgi:hypothetical protein